MLKNKLFIALFVLVSGLCFCLPAMAVELATSTPTSTAENLILPETTIIQPWANFESNYAVDKSIGQDYYLKNDLNNFSVHVKTGTTEQNLNIVLRELNSSWFPTGVTVDENWTPNNLERISPVYEYDFITDGKVEAFSAPIALNLKMEPLLDSAGSTDMRHKIWHFWDKNKNVWRPLRSVADLDHAITGARTYQSYGIVALFIAKVEYEAWASWYADSLTPSSKYNGASNMYKIGTKVKVCRLDNLNKCVKIKIVSTGPYVDNRIVDLTKTAFRTIGNPGGGIVGVRVVPIN